MIGSHTGDARRALRHFQIAELHFVLNQLQVGGGGKRLPVDGAADEAHETAAGGIGGVAVQTKSPADGPADGIGEAQHGLQPGGILMLHIEAQVEPAGISEAAMEEHGLARNRDGAAAGFQQGVL